MNRSVTVNILFCGTGGQGVLKASDVCGWAALLNGYQVKKSEVHGMAQRGGSVESHLRFGKNVFSPLIPRGEVDYLVALHNQEHERLKACLKPQGIDLINDLKEGEKIFANKNYLNTFLLGVLSRYLPIQKENWIKALKVSFPSKNREENVRAFLQGRSSYFTGTEK